MDVDDRVKRANLRNHFVVKIEDAEPLLHTDRFDFYGAYVRISEDQKYKYAEGRLLSYYKDLISEAM